MQLAGRDIFRRSVSARDLFWLGFFAAVLAAWGWLYLMAVERGGPLWAETLASLCGVEAGRAGIGAVWGMWAAMSVAMMLPTLLPMLAGYQRFALRVSRPVAGQAGLVLGFLAVWLGFSGIATLVQVRLSAAGLVDARGVVSVALQGALLMGAGLWQFTGVKARCQSACLSPMAYFLGRFRAGFGGGLRMGLEIGRDCLGCCWAIMALGFVGGVMNLGWMGVATVLMVLEKLPGPGQAVRRPLGGVMVASALAVWGMGI
ncbi:DUF2182 domain-containing protein [Sagittula salina]|uniref:DUF2182 domain-containing protein n=1 Tax=Sagittula salina TaxID=2820268 RepID=A0A940MN62_9RHOB|nr:DUF2182 domain-containing protein [Sagittula salina]MBP0481837.1 DUF2182 domain-containing protein [Sagittula salina]